MEQTIILGLDCGGTNTDAALLNVQSDEAAVITSAKTPTDSQDLPQSIKTVLEKIKSDAPEEFKKISRITLGTTLEINAIVEKKADKVGLALTAGSGIDPVHFGIGDYVYIVPGGLDHRGVETNRLYLDELPDIVSKWVSEDIKAFACAGKFSPRNPAHEDKISSVISKYSSLPVTRGHNLSGQLNFPRRIATAYYNAAVNRIHKNFLDSMEKAFKQMGLISQYRLLKADGGAIPFSFSKNHPVQSILSGPAASVMGALALGVDSNGCSLLLDIGGTTTDIALFVNGSPVIDRNGMILEGRHTLVKSLASISIGIGGDSYIHQQKDKNKEFTAGPERFGPAMAFGGSQPSLMDALNVLNPENTAGTFAQSKKGLIDLAQNLNLNTDDGSIQNIARQTVNNALKKIAQAAYALVENINSKPVYTLAALKAAKEARPNKIYLVGGPAPYIKDYLSSALGLPVELINHANVANAIGAAVTLPTASLEIYADTSKGVLTAPAINYEEKISHSYDLKQAKQKATTLLRNMLQKEGIDNVELEILEESSLATLDDYGYGSKDMRVVCQIKPGIIAQVK